MINKADFYFRENLKQILDSGVMDENPRPKYIDGTPAHSKFITQVFEKYDISKGEFPIPTVRNTAIKMGINEILWIYLDQDSSLESAHKRGVNWWDSWDIGDGTIGQRYGATVRKYDLMNTLLDGLKNDPFSRRHIIDLWQESDLKSTKGLSPCAFMSIWSVRKVDGEYYLDLTLNQRSNDYIVAGYINKIQYVALQMMVAGTLGYKVGNFAHMVQNLHVYDRHEFAIDEILSLDSLEIQPRIELINVRENFYDYTIDDFKIIGVSDIPKLSRKLELAI